MVKKHPKNTLLSLKNTIFIVYRASHTIIYCRMTFDEIYRTIIIVIRRYDIVLWPNFDLKLSENKRLVFLGSYLGKCIAIEMQLLSIHLTSKHSKLASPKHQNMKLQCQQKKPPEQSKPIYTLFTKYQTSNKHSEFRWKDTPWGFHGWLYPHLAYTTSYLKILHSSICRGFRESGLWFFR